MKLCLHEIDTHEVVQVTQENMVELLRFWNDRTADFDLVENETGIRVKSSIPHPLFNNKIKTTLIKDAVEEIKLTIKDYQTRHVPFLWRVWDHDTPNNLSRILLECGGQQLPSTTLMAIDLQAFFPMTETYPNLMIKKVCSPQEGLHFAKCTSSSFGMPAELITTAAELISKQHENISNYVGYINEKPVANCTIFYHDGVAGIYNVGTISELQGKGIGIEMMTTILLKAKLDGYKMAILHSTAAGKSFYEKLGFSQYGEMEQYLFG